MYIATIHCHIQILTTAFAGKGWESFSISELIQVEQGGRFALHITRTQSLDWVNFHISNIVLL